MNTHPRLQLLSTYIFRLSLRVCLGLTFEHLLCVKCRTNCWRGHTWVLEKPNLIQSIYEPTVNMISSRYWPVICKWQNPYWDGLENPTEWQAFAEGERMRLGRGCQCRGYPQLIPPSASRSYKPHQERNEKSTQTKYYLKVDKMTTFESSENSIKADKTCRPVVFPRAAFQCFPSAWLWRPGTAEP